MTLAHAGGLDEILYFLAPILLYLVFREIRRRRTAKGDDRDDDEVVD